MFMSFLPVGMMTDALTCGLATRVDLVVEIVFALEAPPLTWTA